MFSFNKSASLNSLGGPQLPKRKVFVSYHHRNDQEYYDMFSQRFSKTHEVVTDHSLDRNIDSSNQDYIIRVIREDYLKGSSCTIVLCGPETSYRKFVDWEIKATLDQESALLGILLPTVSRNQQGHPIIPERLADNIESGYAHLIDWNNLIAMSDVLSYYVNQAVEHSKESSSLISNSSKILK